MNSYDHNQNNSTIYLKVLLSRPILIVYFYYVAHGLLRIKSRSQSIHQYARGSRPVRDP